MALQTYMQQKDQEDRIPDIQNFKYKTSSKYVLAAKLFQGLFIGLLMSELARAKLIYCTLQKCLQLSS